MQRTNKGEKAWWQSKTMIGLALASAGLIAQSSETIAFHVGEGPGQIVTAFGLLLAAYGRWAATARITLALLLAATLMVGCANTPPGGTRSHAGYESQGPLAHLLDIDAIAQRTIQEYQGEPPSAVVASGQGVENYGPVPFGSVSATFPGGTQLVASVPNDFEATRLRVILPDGTEVDAEGLSVSTSAVVQARTQFVTAVVPVLLSMTEGQRAAALAEIEAQAAAGDAFLAGVLPVLRALVGSP